MLPADSKTSIRKLVENGGVVVNGEKITNGAAALGPETQLPGGHLVVRVGSKEFHNFKI